MSMSLTKNVKRVLTGTIMGLVVIACLSYGGIALLLLMFIAISLGSKEYVRILENKGFFPSLKVILFSDAILAILSYFDRFDLIAMAFTFCTIGAFMWVLFRGRQPYIANVSTTILGFVYSGWFPLHLLFLRGLNSTNHGFLKLNIQNAGLGYVIFLFVTILLTDVGSYYFGKKFGKHPLAPVISPKKTVEGAVYGGLFAILGAVVTGHFIHLDVMHSIIGGLLGTLFAQLGDLSESLIKRDAGVKDSGNLLPGHGGFLDRTDSYVLTVPVMYYYFKYFVVSHQLGSDFLNFIKVFFHAILH